MPVVLWTDGLFFLLLIMLGAYVVHVLRNPHAQEPWLRVGGNRLGMAAGVLLSAFLVVGVLDSMHYYPGTAAADPAAGQGRSGQMISVLDKLLTPLREQVEKSYSAPFALTLNSRETVIREDGSLSRERVRLQYGGAHLQHPGQRRADILQRSLLALWCTVLVWSLLCAALLVWLAARLGASLPATALLVLRGRCGLACRSALATLFLVLLFISLAAELGTVYHLFGTDKVGQDVLYITLKSIRTGLLIGTLTTFVMLPFALLLGIMAGYFRGWIDDLIQYLYTTLNSIPGVLLIAAAILILQVYMASHADDFTSLEQRADMRLLFLCMILGVTSWTGLCRLLRGESLKLAQIEYIQAAHAFGVGHWQIIRRHILPNVMHIVMITVVLDFSTLVLAEAVLSYVNIGVDPATNSWGNMINSARLELAREPVVWWSLSAAFAFMFVLVLSANLFADAVRDAFDPRLQNS